MSLSIEEIIRMTREAGIPLAWVSDTGVIQWSQLERFANAAYAAGAAAEREACAEIVDNWETPDCGGWHAGGIVDAIRARGNGGEQ